jgi:hypothetical protein
MSKPRTWRSSPTTLLWNTRTTMGKSRLPRLATFQVAITLHREDGGAGAPTKTPPTVDQLEQAIKAVLVREGFPAHRVSAMRTDI